MKQFLLFVFILLGGNIHQHYAMSQMAKKVSAEPPFTGKGKAWVDSLMNTLSVDERIGQLFMVAAYSNKDAAHRASILKLVREQHIGGVIFMQGGPVRQAHFNNMLQKASKVPLMVSIDGEWGLSMRLDSTIVFPKQMTLGAIQNDSLIYRMGSEIARQCKKMGIHVNFAPVVDVNNNSANPVINMRSFGENKYNVAAKGIAYMKGMQDAGILANAKHFPGHGDTETDSHKALPTIMHSRERLDSIELYPFRELISNGFGSMMVAHLFIPSLDNTANTATTLSSNVVTKLLKEEMGFKGLIFTDALNMKGVSAYNQPGIVDVKALLAGNDVLLFAENVPAAKKEILKAVQAGEITQNEIDKRVRKILEAKYWCGLNTFKPIETNGLVKALKTSEAQFLRRRLYEAALTVPRNEKMLMPIKRPDTLRIAALSIDASAGNTFQKTLSKYTKVSHFSVQREELNARKQSLINQLRPFNMVVVAVHNPKHTMNKKAGYPSELNAFMAELNELAKTVIVHFANPYALELISESALPNALIQAYEDNNETQELSAQVIFGGVKTNGKLPISAGPFFPAGSGLSLSDVIRLKFTVPEEIGIPTGSLNIVDSLVQKAIRQGATPGAQVLIAHEGRVFYEKSFGRHTYDKRSREVENQDVYDIASITKIAASTLSIMKLTDSGFIDPDKKVGDYIPAAMYSNKGHIRLRDILTHQAGLPAWIPFYKETIKTETHRRNYYRSEPSDSFPFQVAKDMFMRFDYPDSIMAIIGRCELVKNPTYKYSDLGYYLFKYLIEQHTKQPFNQYVADEFYNPMGLSRIGYLPLERIEEEEIVPTENDKIFRKQLIKGYVHDQGAAMMGGVAGHAGLFSNATDLAALMQMLINKGVYGGKRYLSEAVIKEFTRCQFCEKDNRRGMGFDKPEMNYSKIGPTCKCVSSLSFGHTGFTGTMAWADPERGLIYIFLSNRVYPDAENKKLNSLSTRVEIQDAIYSLLP